VPGFRTVFNCFIHFQFNFNSSPSPTNAESEAVEVDQFVTHGKLIEKDEPSAVYKDIYTVSPIKQEEPCVIDNSRKMYHRRLIYLLKQQLKMDKVK
jgi:hypothetical protein